ncbi:gap junction beta-1 protein-like [Polyodon spathula]|uniref:gap junction beta-1 protein-like n=1 Tax=Polyodon spathula TaxID=7913 RepID=UPI001B7E1A5C|nr:gap junction beta-1 protein-like [Polyodon spathula]
MLHTERITMLLSGTGPLSTSLSRFCLSTATLLRLLTLVLEGKTAWRDREGGFLCNTSVVGCHAACFDQHSPIAPFNLYCLQLIFLFTLALAVALLHQPGPPYLHSRPHMHFLSLLGKAIIEGLFLLIAYQLYSTRPSETTCSASPCQGLVMCKVLGARVSDALSLLVCSCSAVSLLVCFFEAYRSLTYLSEKLVGKGAILP